LLIANCHLPIAICRLLTIPIPVEKLSQAFRVGVFRFTLKPQQTLFVPAVNKTNMLRGAFGTAFRRLCCIPQCRNAHECPLATACPYKQIFEPSPPPDSERLSKSQDVPRPFIFRSPENAKTRFLPGEEFKFELVLIGRALEFLPYFVLSFRELAIQGLGLNRAKCDLHEVKEVVNSDVSGIPADGSNDPSGIPQMTRFNVIYNSADQVFHTPKGLDLEVWLRNRIDELNSSESPITRSKACTEAGRSDHPITRSADVKPALRQAEVIRRSPDHRITRSPDPITLKISFLTPTLLKAEGSVIRKPEFHHLFKRLRDRINALSVFFGTGPLDVDFAELGRRAEQVRTVSCNVQWEERFRTSSKTHQRHELSGFVGEAAYEGELQEFLPWLALGELVHVGKHTAWGMGRIGLPL
jgi:CRISPR/Cas system endoribonuclease Cas6 (RAMP superfamily)